MVRRDGNLVLIQGGIAMKVSDRSAAMQASPIRKLVPYANEAKKRGTKVYQLNIGHRIRDAPNLLKTVKKKRNVKVLAYADSNGWEPLVKAFHAITKESALPYETEDTHHKRGQRALNVPC